MLHRLSLLQFFHFHSVCFKGIYQGQWQRGMRHGYGVRQSAPFGMASRFRPKHRGSMSSLRSNEGGGGHAAPTPDPAEKRTHRIDDARGGFVLRARSDDPPPRRNSLVEKTRKGLLSVSKPLIIFKYYF